MLDILVHKKFLRQFLQTGLVIPIQKIFFVLDINNKVLLQWGYTTTNANMNTKINFPISFSSTNYSAFSSDIRDAKTQYGYNYTNTKTNNSCYFVSDSPFNWVCIGF